MESPVWWDIVLSIAILAPWKELSIKYYTSEDDKCWKWERWGFDVFMCLFLCVVGAYLYMNLWSWLFVSLSASPTRQYSLQWQVSVTYSLWISSIRAMAGTACISHTCVWNWNLRSQIGLAQREWTGGVVWRMDGQHTGFVQPYPTDFNICSIKEPRE